MSTNSSERTVTAGDLSLPNPSANSLSGAHHFVSIKLTYRNFLFKRTQLVPFLRGQELLSYVDGETPCPPPTIPAAPATSESASDATTATPTPNPAYRAWVKQDQALLSLLISSLSDEVMHLAVGKTTSRAVWESIGAALGSSTRARCLSLLGQFHSLRQGNSTATEYLGRAQLLVKDLAHAGRPISLDEQNLFVFRGLRPEYRAMASSLTATGTPVTIPQIADYLRAQEFIYSDDYPASPDSAMISAPDAMFAGRGRRGGGESGRGGSGSGGRNSSHRGRGGQGRGRGGRGGAPRCQICRVQGHTTLYCYKCYAPQPAPQGNMVVSGDETAAASTTASWFPDTGATAHATPDASMMSPSEEYAGGDVLRVGNGTGLIISRVGHATIPSMSKVLRLSNVLHVPKLSVPLLSVYRLTNENNVFVEFHKNCFIVKDTITKAVLLKGLTSGGLYKLPVSQSHFAYISARATPTVWHRRLGHPNGHVRNRVLKSCPVACTG
ncbi:PREDICTED: uncharacterized protein LOC109154202 [Ipomoea nil]|uniref:uncharacterized protein LOC109154202 n=1 Tax=Ipomoea nil TaxID=35883 RepID=UPI000901BC06|nr:PREDICTED: uncharacterized protein LOC109154202 [Ipomoea nil]